MKRSEMLDIIKDKIPYEVQRSHWHEWHHFHRAEIAKTILDAIEKAGMMPPKIQLDPRDPYVFMWEPENKPFSYEEN